MITTAIAQ